jgi:hypothetical protein
MLREIDGNITPKLNAGLRFYINLYQLYFYHISIYIYSI